MMIYIIADSTTNPMKKFVKQLKQPTRFTH
jgi:hypothetical protein